MKNFFDNFFSFRTFILFSLPCICLPSTSCFLPSNFRIPSSGFLHLMSAFWHFLSEIRILLYCCWLLFSGFCICPSDSFHSALFILLRAFLLVHVFYLLAFIIFYLLSSTYLFLPTHCLLIFPFCFLPCSSCFISLAQYLPHSKFYILSSHLFFFRFFLGMSFTFSLSPTFFGHPSSLSSSFAFAFCLPLSALNRNLNEILRYKRTITILCLASAFCLPLYSFYFPSASYLLSSTPCFVLLFLSSTSRF